MIGANDIYKGLNADEIIVTYQKIVNELVNNNINVFIQSTLLTRGKDKFFNEKINELNHRLKIFAQSSELIVYIDLNDALSNGSDLSEIYTNDGLHLNGKGYKIWRDIIEQYII